MENHQEFDGDIGNDELVEQISDVNELQASQSTITDTNLQQVNEDCLLEIFSALHPIDLCSLAETCKRFREITQSIVPKTIRIWPDRPVKFNVEFGNLFKGTREDVQRIFKNFGTGLSAVNIVGYSEDTFLLHLITEYCTDDNLESLAMYDVKILDDLTDKLIPIFKRLQKLQLQYVKIMDDTTLFANLVSLIELRISRVDNCGAILENIFPKLECFQYERHSYSFRSTRRKASWVYIYTEETLETWSTFISSHKTLQKLSITADCAKTCGVIIPQLIGHNCKELKELILCIGGMNCSSLLQPFQSLKSLQTLELWKVTFGDFKLFSDLTELQELILCQCRLPDDSNQFCCLTQLKKLKLGSSCGSYDVADVISRLINLDVFAFLNVLEEETFPRILSLVRGRPKVLTLECIFYFVAKKYDNQNVRLLRYSRR